MPRLLEVGRSHSLGLGLDLGLLRCHQPRLCLRCLRLRRRLQPGLVGGASLGFCLSEVVRLDCGSGFEPPRIQALRLHGRELGRSLRRRRRRQPAGLGAAIVRLELGGGLGGGSALWKQIAQQIVPH